MSALLTAAELRVQYLVETDLSDAALTEIIDAETEAVRQFVGTSDGQTVTETFYPSEGQSIIQLAQDVGTITSVVSDGTTLTTDNYTQYGTNVLTADWGAAVTVTYTPAFASGIRSRCRITLVQLVKLWLAYNGHSIVTGPDVSIHPLDYSTERAKLLTGLSTDWVIV